jgi:hypothetical protein
VTSYPSGPVREFPGWKKGTALVLVVLVFSASGARQQVKPRPVEVAGLHVVDEDGRGRIVLDTSRDSATSLTLNNTDRVPGILLVLRPNGEKALLLRDAKNAQFAAINLSADGTAAVSIQSRARSGLTLSANAEGGTFLEFFHRGGKARIRLGLQADGSPRLEFFDEAGKSTSGRPFP